MYIWLSFVFVFFNVIIIFLNVGGVGLFVMVLIFFKLIVMVFLKVGFKFDSDILLNVGMLL